MKKRKPGLKALFVITSSLIALSFTDQKPSFIDTSFKAAEKQYQFLEQAAEKQHKFPRTLSPSGQLVGTDEWDWTGGFFPGSLWYIYNHTHNKDTEAAAIKWTEALEKAKDLDQHHDIGFVMYCSYGNAIKYLNDPKKVAAYKDILIHSANTALKRYNPQVGVIKSWNEKKSWDGKTLWKYPVIIDNMMNLEMLCYVSDLTGDAKYKDAAISHATQTMKNHFRKDYSTYHVVDYDAKGNAIHQQTNQGYADNSTWARGQAWAIYGFTMMYRETKKPEFLKTAKAAAKFYMTHPNLPKDKIPYWDFNAGKPSYKSDADFSSLKLNFVPRDASAAAIVASALIELSTLTTGTESKSYLTFAQESLQTLSGSTYFAKYTTNGGFLLQHSVGSLPHHSEIDVPLTYADYYYLEGLTRLEQLKK
ncbi:MULTISPECIES: glycoside hydrolase family 88 protein [Sphingobacterium]|uniref:glycoside hydrolase family 88 protein n=1 Tax=Sphingobacterium TaxID=28453 RepID=UPI00257E3CC7|nr:MULTISPECIES: glycoside hydrolase family 88 protein [Sphingobacterium]